MNFEQRENNVDRIGTCIASMPIVFWQDRQIYAMYSDGFKECNSITNQASVG